MEVERSIWLRKKTNKLQVHPYKPVSWLPTHQRKSSDEWATTKQACKDELVVYLSFFLAIYYTYYIYITQRKAPSKRIQGYSVFSEFYKSV